VSCVSRRRGEDSRSRVGRPARGGSLRRWREQADCAPSCESLAQRRGAGACSANDRCVVIGYRTESQGRGWPRELERSAARDGVDPAGRTGRSISLSRSVVLFDQKTWVGTADHLSLSAETEEAGFAGNTPSAGPAPDDQWADPSPSSSCPFFCATCRKNLPVSGVWGADPTSDPSQSTIIGPERQPDYCYLESLLLG